MSGNFVKTYRSLMHWEWYQTPHMGHLYMHLILSANYVDSKWRGMLVKRGQLVTGLNSLSVATGISVQAIRTCLKRLENTGEINRQSTNQFSIITICNYSQYQAREEGRSKNPNKRVTSEQQAINSNIRSKELKKESLYDFKLFWDAFSDKRGKKEALSEWNKIKLNDVLFQKIINAAKDYARERVVILERGSTPKMAQGWLSDERWEDEMPIPEPKKKFQQSAYGSI